MESHKKPILKVIGSLPDGISLYAVGDIHGCQSQLKQLLEKIRQDAKLSVAVQYLIFLGDYIDRGPESKAVIETLLSGIPPGFRPIYLRGNHEDALLRFLADDLDAGREWLQYGGMATAMSYGVTPPLSDSTEQIKTFQHHLDKAMPQAHKDFLKSTQLFYDVGDFHFVHAGIRPGLPLEQQTSRDRMWIRGEFLDYRAPHPKTIVHGHSITHEPDLQSNRIGIDTGAFATGRLTALVLQGDSYRFLST